jgi:hypothetical protein
MMMPVVAQKDLPYLRQGVVGYAVAQLQRVGSVVQAALVTTFVALTLACDVAQALGHAVNVHPPKVYWSHQEKTLVEEG